MASSTRTLLIILAAVGGIGFACFGLPLAILFVVPAFQRERSPASSPELRSLNRPSSASAQNSPWPASARNSPGPASARHSATPANPFEETVELLVESATPEMPEQPVPGQIGELQRSGFGPTGFGPQAIPPGTLPPGAYPPSAFPPGYFPGSMGPPPGWIPPPGFTPPPGWPPTRMTPPGFGPSNRPQPPTRASLPADPSSSRRTTTRTSSGATGVPEGISESQRRTIYKASLTSKDHDALCETHRIKKAELEQIVAEGKRSNW